MEAGMPISDNTKPLNLADLADISEELFMRTMGEIVVPNMRDNAEIAKAAVIQEIDAQDLIDSGRFRESIKSSVDLHNLDEMTIEVWSDAKSDQGFLYPVALEYGTVKMAARAPFRKSMIRMESVFR